jgi:hypothetical protein
LSSVDIEVAEPLALRERGMWDPAEEYWGEPGASCIRCGRR